MIYSVVVALLLGLLSIFPPYLGFLYSGKIIKEVKNRGYIKGLIIFGISGGLISVVFNVLPLVYIFFGIYGIMILFYFLMEKTILEKWDKAFIITCISIVAIFIIYYTNLDFFKYLNDGLTKQITETMSKFDKNIPQAETLKIIEDFFNNLLSYMMIFIFFSNILTYVVIDKKNWEKWEFSYIYLIPYIVFFLLNKYGTMDKYIIYNLMESIKYIYVIYGLKEFYINLKNKSKLKFFSIGIAILIYSIQPFILFVYGALKSFKLTKKED